MTGSKLPERAAQKSPSTGGSIDVQPNEPSIYLTLHRVIDAPVERVYAAWTDPDVLRRWLAPGHAEVTRASTNVVVGGTILIEMRGVDGRMWLTRGVYREVVPYRRLVHTWRWEGSDVESLVTVEFEPESADSTRLTLTHSQFAQEEARNEHEHGWVRCLAKLEVMWAG